MEYPSDIPMMTSLGEVKVSMPNGKLANVYGKLTVNRVETQVCMRVAVYDGVWDLHREYSKGSNREAFTTYNALSASRVGLGDHRGISFEARAKIERELLEAFRHWVSVNEGVINAAKLYEVRKRLENLEEEGEKMETALKENAVKQEAAWKELVALGGTLPKVS
jgi:hypothetical protein